MGAGHAHVLYRDAPRPVHRLPPEVKIAAMVLFTVAVVATPARGVLGLRRRTPCWWPSWRRWPGSARGWLLSRALIELPFVLFAVALPFLGAGERVEVARPAPVRRRACYGAWNIVAKGTLGVLASLLLAATTTTRDLIVGLDRLRCPQILTQIATFMLRYLDVLIGEARRMRVARISRGDDPRFLWQLRGFAAGVGRAVPARLRARRAGLPGDAVAGLHRPDAGGLAGAGAATAGQWAAAATVPVVAAAIAAAAVVLT